MRSGREHLAWILAVEVRQGTLGVDGRGWGPAGNTWRGYSRLRSGREHWGVDGRGWGPAENTVDRGSQLDEDDEDDEDDKDDKDDKEDEEDEEERRRRTRQEAGGGRRRQLT